MRSEVRLERAPEGRVRIDGRLTFETVDERLLERSREVFTAPGDLVIDFAGVAEGDSAGLALMIEWRSWADRDGRSIVFEQVPASLIGIADISDVSEILGLALD
ncbi:MAG: STAS domain-containing protein [Gammaproteobacteria bacterium]|nr:STAS domain-containing protein [Gammaproteobacteria bacterium]